VIMGQMEETRKDLAEKLETLEKKVAGTVETVTGTVQTVESTVENVKESIQETVATVTDTVQNTVQAVEDKVGSTVESVRNFLDLSRQVDQHPWLMMGGSVLVGFLGGRLLTPRRVRGETTSQKAIEPTYASPPAPRHNGAAHAAQESRAAQETGEKAGESWLHRLGDHFGDEVEKLKGLAVGTLFGVTRDMVSQWLPDALKGEVTDVINGFTTSLGGKVIGEPLLQSAQDQQEMGRADESPNRPETKNRPEPASTPKGEKVGGRSGRR